MLSVALAFLFGYTLTSLPLLRASLTLAVVVLVALAVDTLSIATMEVIDNMIMVGVPGAMDAGLGDVLFWGSLSFALVVAGVVAFPVNRWLIARGRGHHRLALRTQRCRVARRHERYITTGHAARPTGMGVPTG